MLGSGGGLEALKRLVENEAKSGESIGDMKKELSSVGFVVEDLQSRISVLEVGSDSHKDQIRSLREMISQVQKSSKYKMRRRISNHTHSPGQVDGPNELKFGMHAPIG